MLNKVTLIGRLGFDPEVRFMPSGGSVTNIRLATTRRWKDRQTNERREETEWHRVVFFNRIAEIAGEYLKKGSLVYIEGRIQTRKWQDQSGQDRYSTEIIAEQMQMLDSKSGGTSQLTESPQPAAKIAPSNPPASPMMDNTSPTSAPSPAPIQPTSEPTTQTPPAASYEDFDDDIPF